MPQLHQAVFPTRSSLSSYSSSLVPRRCVDFGQGPDDLISTTSGGLRLTHGTDLHIQDYNIRVRVHSLRSRCSYHTGMTSTNTDNHSVVCELGAPCHVRDHVLHRDARSRRRLFFVVFASRVVEEQTSIRKGLPRRAAEEIRTSNAKQSLSCDKL